MPFVAFVGTMIGCDGQQRCIIRLRFRQENQSLDILKIRTSLWLLKENIIAPLMWLEINVVNKYKKLYVIEVLP